MVTKIDRVMSKAETPYVRLNDNNEFEAVNDSFVKMLEYPNEIELKREDGSRTFKSLLTQKSIHLYEKKLNESLNNKDSLFEEEEYVITLYTYNGGMIEATVYGERIIFPSIRKKKYPSRFGIVIKWKKVKGGKMD